MTVKGICINNDSQNLKKSLLPSFLSFTLFINISSFIKMSAEELSSDDSSYNGSKAFNIILSLSYIVTFGLIMYGIFSTLSIAFIISMFMLLIYLFVLSVIEMEHCQHPGSLSDNVFHLKNLGCSCIRSFIIFWAFVMLVVVLCISPKKG
ncbi:hypothetical protein DFJ63DRAFT_215164 [Scheffersomyces coipomensis]|uniref:uncharacterized protein n=1 Tax=Scheffersomyces coipomensis TaxID=1788519 RepID=UPI00315D1AC4